MVQERCPNQTVLRQEDNNTNILAATLAGALAMALTIPSLPDPTTDQYRLEDPTLTELTPADETAEASIEAIAPLELDDESILPIAEDDDYPLLPAQKVIVTGRARSDNPHKSGNTTSGHGWWYEARGVKRGLVSNTLYGKGFLGWYSVSQSPTLLLKPGGGRGKRTNARAKCWGSGLYLWKNTTRLDLPLKPGDVPIKPGFHSSTARVDCKPWK